MRGPRGPRKTSTDDPAAIIGTMTCRQLCLSFIPDENIFGPRIRFSVSIFCIILLGLIIVNHTQLLHIFNY